MLGRTFLAKGAPGRRGKPAAKKGLGVRVWGFRGRAGLITLGV